MLYGKFPVRKDLTEISYPPLHMWDFTSLHLFYETFGEIINFFAKANMSEP